MRKLRKLPLQNILLALEALLVIMGIIAGSDAKSCMACYWAIIMIYHAAEFLAEVGDDGDDREEKKIEMVGDVDSIR